MTRTEESMFPAGVSKLAAQAMARAGELEEQPLGDGRVARLERAPNPSILFRIAIVESGRPPTYPIVVFQPSDTRPDSYPPDLPFVTQRQVSFGTGSGKRLLAWTSPRKGAELTATLVRTCVEDGWELASEESHWLGTARRELRRGAQVRLIMSAKFPPIVELIERRVGL